MKKIVKLSIILIIVALIGIFSEKYSYAGNNTIELAMEADKSSYTMADGCVQIDVKVTDLPLKGDGTGHIEINVIDFILEFDKEIFEVNKVQFSGYEFNDLTPLAGWSSPEYDEETGYIGMVCGARYSNVNEAILRIRLKIKKEFTSANIYLRDISASGGNGSELNPTSRGDVRLVLGEQGSQEQMYLKTTTESPYKIGDTKDQEIDEYVEGDLYLSRIAPKTDMDTFVRNLDTNADYLQIFDKDGNPVDDGLVGTGMRIVLSKQGCQDIELILVVTGDIDGDGYVTAADLADTIRGTLGIASFTEEQNRAVDMDEDGYITAADLADEIKYTLM